MSETWIYLYWALCDIITNEICWNLGNQTCNPDSGWSIWHAYIDLHAKQVVKVFTDQHWIKWLSNLHEQSEQMSVWGLSLVSKLEVLRIVLAFAENEEVVNLMVSTRQTLEGKRSLPWLMMNCINRNSKNRVKRSMPQMTNFTSTWSWPAKRSMPQMRNFASMWGWPAKKKVCCRWQISHGNENT